MARYFIDTHDGTQPLLDEDGIDLVDAAKARIAALSALPDMAKDHTPNGDHRRYLVRVRSENGRVIYCATLVLSGGWCEDDGDPLAADFA